MEHSRPKSRSRSRSRTRRRHRKRRRKSPHRSRSNSTEERSRRRHKRRRSRSRQRERGHGDDSRRRKRRKVQSVSSVSAVCEPTVHASAATVPMFSEAQSAAEMLFALECGCHWPKRLRKLLRKLDNGELVCVDNVTDSNKDTSAQQYLCMLLTFLGTESADQRTFHKPKALRVSLESFLDAMSQRNSAENSGPKIMGRKLPQSGRQSVAEISGSKMSGPQLPLNEWQPYVTGLMDSTVPSSSLPSNGIIQESDKSSMTKPMKAESKTLKTQSAKVECEVDESDSEIDDMFGPTADHSSADTLISEVLKSADGSAESSEQLAALKLKLEANPRLQQMVRSRVFRHVSQFAATKMQTAGVPLDLEESAAMKGSVSEALANSLFGAELVKSQKTKSQMRATAMRKAIVKESNEQMSAILSTIGLRMQTSVALSKDGSSLRSAALTAQNTASGQAETGCAVAAKKQVLTVERWEAKQRKMREETKERRGLRPKSMLETHREKLMKDYKKERKEWKRKRKAGIKPLPPKPVKPEFHEYALDSSDLYSQFQ